MSTMLENLKAQWTEAKTQIESITERAAADGREMTAAEKANFDALRAQITDLEPRIKDMVEVERSFDSTAELFSSVSIEGRTNLTRSQGGGIMAQYETPGDYLFDVFRAYGTQPDIQARERVRAAAMVTRDSTTQINGATVQNETLAEVASIVPEPIVGNLWSSIDSRRAIVSAGTTMRPITGPLMFRPKVQQHTAVGPQGAGTPAGAAGAGKLGKGAAGAVAANDEKSAFVSRKMTLGRVNIEPIAVGGVVDISLWAEMLSPGLLNIIVSDLAEQYAIETEALAAAELARAGGTQGAAIDLTASGAGKQLQSRLYEAAADVYRAIGRLPNTVAVSVDVWALLGGMVDTQDRPMFPTLAPQNVPGATMTASSFGGGNPVGFNLVVSPALGAKSMIVYSSTDLEIFERRLGVLQAIEPERAGRVVSYSGLFQAVAMDDGAAEGLNIA